MGFNIQSFKSNGLVHGGARPSLFEIQMSAPRGIGLSNRAIAKMTFLVEATELPSSTIQPVSVPYFGRTIKLAGDRTFQDWTVTILNDEDFAIRAMLESWHNSLNTMVTNERLASNPADYKSEHAFVTQFSKDGSAIRSYEFRGLFPTEISAIQLAWDTTNQIERFNCTFAYDFWVPAIENPAYDTYAQDVGTSSSDQSQSPPYGNFGGNGVSQ